MRGSKENSTKIFSFFIENVSIAIEEGLQKGGDLNEIKHSILNGIYKYLGGVTIYIPVDNVTNISGRNSLILEDFNGSNHFELSRKYGLSLQAIYNIINRYKKN
ncbi:Mor transcription activator family protein [Mannheimia haemolytica]|uniref:Mor transcription activator family protein n=1 Tax=Mannheimia haemolytica TaxID=75985 RepID=UPI002ECE8656|nr:Mor transcription activator family protein [Mannheimia haemolytica]